MNKVTIIQFVGVTVVASAASIARAGGVIFVDASNQSIIQNGTTWLFAFDDLQDALDVADPGDQVWVANGVYKPTTGTDRSAAFSLESGVEIYGGFAGGEVLLAQRDPEANIATLSGEIGSAFTDADNSFHVLTAINVNSACVLDGFSVVEGNANGVLPDNRGGGLRLGGTSSPMVRNCKFIGNTALSGGGAIYNSAGAGSPSFINCEFAANASSSGPGGAIDNESGSFTLINCEFRDNEVTTNAGGGAVRVLNGGGLFVNCIFRANGAASSGGAVSASGSTISFHNCTLTQNTSAGNGGGVFATSNTTVNITNSILHGNTDAGPQDQSAQLNTIGGTVNVNFSDIQGLTASLGGAGNIDADPKFVDPDGADNVPSNDDDLRLRGGSPCVDAGNSQILPLDPFDLDGDGSVFDQLPFDIAGADRRQDDPLVSDTGVDTAVPAGVVDMGAHEFFRPFRLILVDQSATGANNGTTWVDAYTNLQSALAELNDPKSGGPGQVWVADGTYKPTAGADRNVSFGIVADCEMYGGFAGGEAAIELRDPIAHPAILSGDIGTVGSVADNSFHVLTADAAFIDESSVVDGFVVTAGNSNGGSIPAIGSGLRTTNGASPLIRNCRFLGNAGTTAGGIGCFSGSHPTVINGLFSGNVVTGSGGAVETRGSGTNLTLINCTLDLNASSNGVGAGVRAADNSHVTLTNCLLFANTAAGSTVAEDDQIGTGNGGTVGINHCAIQGLSGGLGGLGNVNATATPGVVDANGADNVAGTLDDDPRPVSCSVVVDAGNNVGLPLDVNDLDGDGNIGEVLPFDLGGSSPRQVDDPQTPNTGNPVGSPAPIDIGAFEFVPVPVVDIVSANPPLDNPYVAGSQPFRDVLDTGSTAALTAGIGGAGTPSFSGVNYSPLSVTFSAAPAFVLTLDSIRVFCTGSSPLCPTVTSVTGSGAGPYTFTLSGPIPPGQCTRICFPGTAATQSLRYQSQPGNVSMDSLTNTQDLLSLVQALNNGATADPANHARFNVNRSTNPAPVNTQDLLRLVQLLNGTLTTEPFNGDGVAACP